MVTTDQATLLQPPTAKAGATNGFIHILAQRLAETMQATSDAVQHSVTNPPAPIHAAAVINEAERQIARLNSVRGAAAGWAGPASTPPNEKSLNAAVRLLQRLKHLPLPIPMASVGSHGNAGLFWSDERLYADVELLEDGRIGYLLQIAGGDAIDDEEDIPPLGLPPHMAAVLAKAYLPKNR